MIIYYNPACSKCNEALNLLEGESCEVEIRNYLEQPPSVDELKEIVTKLGCSAVDLVRKSEPLFLEKFNGQALSEMEWMRVLSENPILIERPILIDGEKAIIGRPPVLVLDLVKK